VSAAEQWSALPTRDVFAEIIRERRSGALDERGFHAMTAAMTAANVGSLRPALYPPLPQQLQNYIRQRSAGALDDDPATTKRLSDWIQSVIRAREENDAIERTIRWGLEKTQDVGLGKESQALEAALDWFKEVRYPAESMRDAIAIQRADWRARQTRESGRSR